MARDTRKIETLSWGLIAFAVSLTFLYIYFLLIQTLASYGIRYSFLEENVATLAQNYANNIFDKALVCNISGLESGQELKMSGWVECAAGVVIDIDQVVYVKP